MDNMIFLLALTREITIDHLSNWRRPIYRVSSAQCSSLRAACPAWKCLRTRKTHELHFLPVVLQRLDEHLALCRFARAVQTLENNELASCHDDLNRGKKQGSVF